MKLGPKYNSQNSLDSRLRRTLIIERLKLLDKQRRTDPPLLDIPGHCYVTHIRSKHAITDIERSLPSCPRLGLYNDNIPVRLLLVIIAVFSVSQDGCFHEEPCWFCPLRVSYRPDEGIAGCIV